MKDKKILILILGLVVVLFGASMLYTVATGMWDAYNQLDDESGRAQNVAPDFTMYDKNGNEVHLQDFVGRPIVLNFWATWCGPCQSEMPVFNQSYLTLEDDTVFLMVSADDSGEKAFSYPEDNGYSLPIYHDTDGEGVAAYNITAFPTTYFIDREGYIVARGIGAVSAEGLKAGLDMARK